jgi:DNA-binding HxlR family transcriptional regulator
MDFCPLENAMEVIGGKWKIPILCSLHQDGVTRYNELKRKVRGITNTMLASSLKELEEAGLVNRKQFMEMPVRVEYSLTEACKDLLPILNQLAHWGIRITKQNDVAPKK